jgi:hypothetical protein
MRHFLARIAPVPAIESVLLLDGVDLPLPVDTCTVALDEPIKLPDGDDLGNTYQATVTQGSADSSARGVQGEQDQTTLTASRPDSGNRLEWHQIGDGLADLPIVQTGGSTMQVTQSNSGAAFALPPGV